MLYLLRIDFPRGNALYQASRYTQDLLRWLLVFMHLRQVARIPAKISRLLDILLKQKGMSREKECQARCWQKEQYQVYFKQFLPFMLTVMTGKDNPMTKRYFLAS